MKKRPRASALTIGSLLLAGAAIGAAAVVVQAQEPAAPSHIIGGDRAKIIVDNEVGVVRIEIDGKPAVLIDAIGLHVERDVKYRGAIYDLGDAVPD